jgi:predicted anti-sigma-YlaC factor YlaD
LATPNDYHAVDCTMYRELLSAGLDGESTAAEQRQADTHLTTCTSCRAWAESASAVTRAARLHAAEDVPDLTAAILMASPAPVPETIEALPVARIGLALVALAQILIGQESLLDAAGMAAHLSREQGVWDIALAIGFATAAWQPRRAAGMVPLVAALVAGLFVTASIDAADGSIGMLSEGHHLVALVGLGLLLVSTRLVSPQRRLVLR